MAVDSTSVLAYPLLVIYILTGPIGAGKTSFLERSLPALRASQPGLDGYLSLRILAGEETAGYDLLDLRSGARTPFLRRGGEPAGQRVGPFSLLPGGLGAAETVLCRGRPGRRGGAGEFLVVDEIGPLELAGGGVWPAFVEALSAGDRPALAVVRESLLAGFLEKFAGREIKVIRLAEAAVGRTFVEELSGP
jgi:nucleoside-triphosphatase THEP1